MLRTHFFFTRVPPQRSVVASTGLCTARPVFLPTCAAAPSSPEPFLGRESTTTVPLCSVDGILRDFPGMECATHGHYRTSRTFGNPPPSALILPTVFSSPSPGDTPVFSAGCRLQTITCAPTCLFVILCSAACRNRPSCTAASNTQQDLTTPTRTIPHPRRPLKFPP